MSLPLHPMIVHLPLALAALMPLIAVGVFLAWRRQWLPARAWAGVVLLQVLLVGAGLVAMNTGEAEEETVEAVVAEEALEHHEEAAELFVWAGGGTAALTLLGLFLPGESRRRTAALLSIFAMAAVTFLAFRVGEAGGELVYRHGAATAYAAAPTAGDDAPAGVVPAAPGHPEDEHDE